MPRQREALTGHVWLESLSTDEKHATVTVWGQRDVAQNIGWLIEKRLLVLCRKSHGEFTAHCYPRRDLVPAPGANHAAAYVADDLADCLQAAVNDYSHTLGMTAQARFTRYEFVRAVVEGLPY